MKLRTVSVVISVLLLVLMAGCTGTGQTETKTATPVQTESPATEIPTEAPAGVQTPVADPLLAGTWYLKLISEQNGTAQVQALNPEITVIFDERSNISGYSGCNQYSGQYTLSGSVLPDGKAIEIGPLVVTKKACIDSATTEATYLEILQAAASYLVNTNQELTITDDSGNALVYQRTPYSGTAVPRGS
ncbi:MAG: META domain-containing protein [Methanospirillum sp.]|nr:META domain-containing protein [Methanospirillum sp.]